MKIKPDSFSSFPVKDTAILIAWISSLLIFAGALWVLTQPLRTRILISAVNRVFEESGDPRRLSELASNGGSGVFGMGAWFTMTGPEAEEIGNTEERKIVVFSFFGEGSFFPSAAIIGPEGRVEEFIPLNNQGRRVISRIAPGILEIYARRFERARL